MSTEAIGPEEHVSEKRKVPAGVRNLLRTTAVAATIVGGVIGVSNGVNDNTEHDVEVRTQVANIEKCLVYEEKHPKTAALLLPFVSGLPGGVKEACLRSPIDTSTGQGMFATVDWEKVGEQALQQVTNTQMYLPEPDDLHRALDSRNSDLEAINLKDIAVKGALGVGVGLGLGVVACGVGNYLYTREETED